MNVFVPRTLLQLFDYQIEKPKGATLERLATKQELIFAGFSQLGDWSVALAFYFAKHSKALAHTHYLSFYEVISSQKLIYKIIGILRKKALAYKAYSRPPPLTKTTVILSITVVFVII